MSKDYLTEILELRKQIVDLQEELDTYKKENFNRWDQRFKFLMTRLIKYEQQEKNKKNGSRKEN